MDKNGGSESAVTDLRHGLILIHDLSSLTLKFRSVIALGYGGDSGGACIGIGFGL